MAGRSSAIFSKPSSIDPRIRFAMLVMLTYSVGFGIIMPVMPTLVMELGHMSLSDATSVGGALVATYAVFQFLFSPLMGNLGDRFGRRPVVLFALLGFAVDYAVMAFAPSLLWLFLGRAVAGGLGAVFAPAQAIVADATPRESRVQAFGLLGAAFGAGFIIGPGIGGMIAGLGTRAPFLAASALALVTLVYGLLRFEETLPPERRRPFSLKRANPLGAIVSLRNVGGIWLLAGAYLLWITAINICPVLWAWFATDRYGWGPGMIGLSLACTGISMAVCQVFVIGPLTARIGPNRAILIGLAGAMAGQIFYIVNGVGWLALIVSLMLGIQGIVQPSLTALLSAAVDDDRQGELLGLNSSLAALAAIAAPLSYNSLFTLFTGSDAPVSFPGAPFALAFLLAAIAMLLVGIDASRRIGARLGDI